MKLGEKLMAPASPALIPALATKFSLGRSTETLTLFANFYFIILIQYISDTLEC